MNFPQRIILFLALSVECCPCGQTMPASDTAAKSPQTGCSPGTAAHWPCCRWGCRRCAARTHCPSPFLLPRIRAAQLVARQQRPLRHRPGLRRGQRPRRHAAAHRSAARLHARGLRNGHPAATVRLEGQVLHAPASLGMPSPVIIAGAA